MKEADQCAYFSVTQSEGDRQWWQQQVESRARPVDGTVTEADKGDRDIFPEREAGKTFGEGHGSAW